MKVLFVDDETEIQEQAEVFLEDEDDRLNIETAGSAEKGLEILEENDFDAIVSDYQMPEKNGLEFLETIREEKDNDIPFIIFTGKGREEIAMEALNLGANRYFQKKGSPRSQYEMLANTIVQEIKHYRAEKEKEKSREEWRKTFDALPDITALVSPEHEFIRINKEGANRLGMNREELIGKKCYRVVHNQDEPIDECPCEMVLEEEESKTGKEFSENDRHYIASAAPIKNESGEIESIAHSVKDITERKKAEEELRESEEKYRKLTEFSPNAIFLIDAESGKIIDVNRQALKLLNLSREDLVDMHHSELYPEEDAERFGKLFETYVPGKGELRTMSMGRDDLYLVGSEGNKIPVNIKSSTFEIGDKKIVQDIYIDITDRKNAEEELKKLSREYETILENVQNSIFLIDVDDGQFRYQRLNPRHEKLTGLKTEDVRGKTPVEALGKELGEKVRENYEECLEKKEPITYEEKLELPEGKRTWLTKLSPVKIENEVEKTVGTSLDITNRKKMQEELRESKNRLEKIFESVEEGIIILDLEGNIVQVNEAAVDMIGYESREDLIGRNAFEFVHPEDREKAVELTMKALDEEEVYSGREYRILGKDGEVIHTRSGSSLLYDDSGELQGTVNVVRDISEQKKRGAEKRKTLIVNSTAEGIVTDVVREFETIVTANGLGLKQPLEYMSDLATEPSSPKNIFDFMITGVKKGLAEKGVEVGREKIRDVLAPHIVELFEEVFPIKKRFGEEIPQEYEELRKELRP